MKKVLYTSCGEVPYRTEFFNQLSKECDLTVLYEQRQTIGRDKNWTESVKSKYHLMYLSKNSKKNAINFNIIKYVFSKKYDKIIIGCFNSRTEMLAILLLKLFRKKYILNLDGETFFEGNSIKSKLKRWFVKGADSYVIAGEKSALNLYKVTNCKKIYPYYFSSLTKKDIAENSKKINNSVNNCILIVGGFCDYKGLDIAIEVSKKMPNIKFKFIGMGKRSEEFEKYLKQVKVKSNVEVIPFLKKEDLNKEYRNCKMLVLPSRQECWGLVINEAASFGTPIVSTWGSGAALEFLSDDYPYFLAESNNTEDLYNKISNLMNYDKIDEYKKYLLKKSKNYNIESMVKKHIKAINKD